MRKRGYHSRCQASKLHPVFILVLLASIQFATGAFIHLRKHRAIQKILPRDRYGGTLLLETHGRVGKKRRQKEVSKKKKRNATPKAKEDIGNKNHSSPNLPPWQVMPTKDAIRNIRNEKVRRESIRKGDIPSTISTCDGEISADIDASSSLISNNDRNLLKWKRFKPGKEVKGLQFIDAYLGNGSLPLLGVPEVAFLGRSNVGKSSLLNKLSNYASIDGSCSKARVGKTPGATASVNLYSIQGKNQNSLMGLVDLPGFGYAKLSRDVKELVEKAAEKYIDQRRELALGILLVGEPIFDINILLKMRRKTNF